MQADHADDTKKKDDLPDYLPLFPPLSTDDSDEPVAEAATETGDALPVLASADQPQKVFDPELVGTSENVDPLKGENTVSSFDPENDIRMQEQAA